MHQCFTRYRDTTRCATMVGASERAITAGNNQVGPMMSSLGNEKYTPPTAANASSACQRGFGLSNVGASVSHDIDRAPQASKNRLSRVFPYRTPLKPYLTPSSASCPGRAGPRCAWRWARGKSYGRGGDVPNELIYNSDGSSIYLLYLLLKII